MNQWLAMGTAIVTFVTVLLSLVVAIRSKKRVDEVHVLVDGRMTDVTNRVDQLIAALQAADMPIPVKRPPAHNHDQERG